VTVIDASGLILGRLASIVAKRLLLGESVIIVNAENAVITGGRRNILEEMQITLGIRNLNSKDKSPKHPRRPDGIVRRTIRGMLPMDKPKGKEAFSKLRVYVGVPDHIIKADAISLEEAKRENIERFMTVGELASNIGWRRMGEY
jgi:large subunit ribosomal protein L13